MYFISNNKYQLEMWLYYIQTINIKKIRDVLNKEDDYDMSILDISINDNRKNETEEKLFFDSL